MVIIDSDVLMTAYNSRQSAESAEISRLLVNGEAATVGIVLAEVLHGAQSESQLGELSEELQTFYLLESGIDVWLLAGRILFELKRSGQSIPLTDAVIAAQALHSDSAIYTHDGHFARVPGLRLHAADEAAS